MRDWLNTLRRASFRGVPFWVDTDGPETGRRVVVHEAAGAEAPVTEDMGRMTRSIWVSAYVTGDVADALGAALEAACSAPGASILVMPIDPVQFVHCTACRRNRRRDRAGYIGYDLQFVEAGSGASFASGGMAGLRDVYSGGLAQGASALASFL